jgi:hypothetical protein
MKLISIKRATNPHKKYTATFFHNNDYIHITFGDTAYSDYTKHKDPMRKKQYLERHKKNENWNDPMSAGALSRWILWEYPDFDKAVKEFKKRFNL